ARVLVGHQPAVAAQVRRDLGHLHDAGGLHFVATGRRVPGGIVDIAAPVDVHLGGIGDVDELAVGGDAAAVRGIAVPGVPGLVAAQQHHVARLHAGVPVLDAQAHGIAPVVVVGIGVVGGQQLMALGVVALALG